MKKSCKNLILLSMLGFASCAIKIVFPYVNAVDDMIFKCLFWSTCGSYFLWNILMLWAINKKKKK